MTPDRAAVELQTLRDRLADLEDRAGRIVRERAEARRIVLGRVTQLVAVPTEVPKVFAVRPERAGWEESPGAAADSEAADPPGLLFVAVLGPAVPGQGDRLTAYKVRDRWVAGEFGPGAPPWECDASVNLLVTSVQTRGPLPGAVVTVQDSSGTVVGTAVTDDAGLGGVVLPRDSTGRAPTFGTYLATACYAWPGGGGECCASRAVDVPGCGAFVRSVSLCCGRQCVAVFDYDTGAPVGGATFTGGGTTDDAGNRCVDFDATLGLDPIPNGGVTAPGYWPGCLAMDIPCFAASAGLVALYPQSKFVAVGCRGLSGPSEAVCGGSCDGSVRDSTKLPRRLAVRLHGPECLVGTGGPHFVDWIGPDEAALTAAGAVWTACIPSPGGWFWRVTGTAEHPTCTQVFHGSMRLTLAAWFDPTFGCRAALGFEVYESGDCSGPVAPAGPDCAWIEEAELIGGGIVVTRTAVEVCEALIYRTLGPWPAFPPPPPVNYQVRNVPSGFSTGLAGNQDFGVGLCGPVDHAATWATYEAVLSQSPPDDYGYTSVICPGGTIGFELYEP